MPEPPAGLSAAEQQRLNSAAAQAASAAAAASAMPSAEQNVAGARAAVAEPQAEANARAAAALSEALGERAAPSPEIEALCARIQEAIRRRRPPDQDALVQFDPQAATQAAGDELNASVQGQSEQVQGNYQQLQQPPSGAPAPPAQPLTPPAGQVESPPIGAQAAVPDPVTPESVSLDADVAVSGNRISEAGMDSEASALITDPANPVSQAREGQVNLSEAAARDPQEVLAEQNAVRDQALGAMQDLQARTLAALQSSRAATAAGVGGGMVRMGGTEAQMRTQASSQAQTIFDGARDQVRSLLEPLPRTALQRWQSGIAVLSSQVEQESEQFNRWKRERYEGVSGAALELVEGVIGLPDWAIDWLNGIEERFGARVCNLLREISVEVNGVIASCEDIIAAANTRIKEVFDALPESLRDWAAGEQAQFSAQLDGLRQEAQNSRDTFNRQLSQEASQAVQSVRERIHTMRQEAGGWVGQISAAIERFAENPARFILEGLLQRLGIDPSAFWGVVNRIGSVIDSIAADPLGFAGTLARAMGQGFGQFFSNVATHISGGFFAWLFSGLGSVGVQIPSDFSLGSLITFFLQLMGITWDRIRGILARYIGEENVALLERAYELIALLIERGPAGIFELLREQLNPQMILDQILSSAVDFMIDALIRAVTPRIIGLFNPAGAILQAIEAIYRILSWLFENAARLFGLVETVVNGAAELIAGNVGGMANAVEGSLARLIAPVIDFLAGYLGVGNLPNQIAETIGGFQEMVLRVIDRVVAWIAQRARGLLRSLGVGGEDKRAQEGEEDLNNHFTLANRIKLDMEELEYQPLSLEELLATKSEQANQLIARYSGFLEEGVGLRIEFKEDSSMQKDQDLDFVVIIAPNTTTVSGSVPTPADPSYPYASAPNIGTMQKHGSQGSSNRNGPRIWWVESEHILPFATGKTLWEALALWLPERGFPEDNQQTTIMIYERAARIKTSEDNKISKAFGSAIRHEKFPEQFDFLVTRYQQGDQDAIDEGRDIISDILAALRSVTSDAVDRTWIAIGKENQEIEDGYTLRNSERRAPPPGQESPIPGKNQVEIAASAQHDDILRLVTASLLDRQALEQKVERILMRRPRS
jgi:hypothetical protein